MSGDSRWDRALRTMALGELATNFFIKRSAADVSPVVSVSFWMKRWPCLVSAQ